jgi:hypothetical protein
VAGIKNSRQLTHRQERALRALLAYPTIREASRAVGIPERTLYRWAGQREFRAVLEQAETDPLAVDRARREYLADDALGVLHEVMSDQTSPAAARIEAARVFLQFLRPMR